jgi:hypothetical protein
MLMVVVRGMLVPGMLVRVAIAAQPAVLMPVLMPMPGGAVRVRMAVLVLVAVAVHVAMRVRVHQIAVAMQMLMLVPMLVLVRMAVRVRVWIGVRMRVRLASVVRHGRGPSDSENKLDNASEKAREPCTLGAPAPRHNSFLPDRHGV